MLESKKIRDMNSPPKMVLLSCKYDLAKICRVCSNECENKVSLFKYVKTSNVTIEIAKMLLICTGLKATLGDGLPMNMCFNCVYELITVYGFIQKCKNTDIKLRKNIFSDDGNNNTETANNTKKNDGNILSLNKIKIKKVSNLNSDVQKENTKEILIFEDSVPGKDNNDKTKSKSLCGKIIINPWKLPKTNTSNEIKKQKNCSEKVAVSRLPDANYSGLNGKEKRENAFDKVILSHRNLPDLRFNNYNNNNNREKLENVHKKILISRNLTKGVNFSDNGRKKSEGTTEKEVLHKSNVFVENKCDDHKEEEIIFEEVLIKQCGFMDVNSSDIDNDRETVQNTPEKTIVSQCNLSDMDVNDIDPEELMTAELVDECEQLTDKPVDENKSTSCTEKCTNCVNLFLEDGEFHEKGCCKASIENEDDTEETTDFQKRCPHCSKLFTEQDKWQAHLKLFSCDYKCTKCCRVYPTFAKFRNHMRTHKPFTYKCRYFSCTETFKTWFDVQQHTKNHVRSHYMCKVCNKIFLSKSGWREHQKIHTGVVKVYPCDVCNKILSTTSSLNHHKKRHNKQYSDICPECGKGCIMPSELKHHIDKCHREASSYQCEFCGKKLRTYSSLKYHIQSYHENKEKKFSCTLCPKKFLARWQLTEHLNRHNKNYTHSCDECENKYYSKRELLAHKAAAHSKERPYKCTKCQKTFLWRPGFHAHEKRHKNPFLRCIYCNSTFVNPAPYQNHILKHEKND